MKQESPGFSHGECQARIEIKCKPEVKRELVARAKAADLTLSQYMLKKALE